MASPPARIDGDTMRVNWRLAECLHDCRGFKQWNAVTTDIKTYWYRRAIKFRAAMLGKELEITPRFSTDFHERWEPTENLPIPKKIRASPTGMLPCIHCGREVHYSQLFRTIPTSKVLDRCIHCADCLHTMHIKSRSDGTIRCKNCGIIIKILKYKGRWA